MKDYKEYEPMPIFLARADGGLEVITRGENRSILTRAVYTDDGWLRSRYEYDEDGVLRKVHGVNGCCALYKNGKMSARFTGDGKIVEEYHEDGSPAFKYRYGENFVQKLNPDGAVVEDLYSNGSVRAKYDEDGRVVSEYSKDRRMTAAYEYYDNGSIKYKHTYSCGLLHYTREYNRNGVPVCDRNNGGYLLSVYNQDGTIKTSYGYKKRGSSNSIYEVIIYKGDHEHVILTVRRGTGETRNRAYFYDADNNLIEEKGDMDAYLRSLTDVVPDAPDGMALFLFES